MIKSGGLSEAVDTAFTVTPAPGSVGPAVVGMQGSVLVAIKIVCFLCIEGNRKTSKS